LTSKVCSKSIFLVGEQTNWESINGNRYTNCMIIEQNDVSRSWKSLGVLENSSFSFWGLILAWFPAASKSNSQTIDFAIYEWKLSAKFGKTTKACSHDLKVFEKGFQAVGDKFGLTILTENLINWFFNPAWRPSKQLLATLFIFCC